jgi:murein tripeptide amidase MpaA
MKAMRGERKAAVLLMILLLGALAGRSQETGEVISISKENFTSGNLERFKLDLLMERNGRIFAVATPRQLAALSARGIEFAFERNEFPSYQRPEIRAAGGINGAFHTSWELETDLYGLQGDYPDLARVVEIGESLEGRKILALKISDNPFLDEQEAPVLFLGAHHAREWISVEIPFLFGKHLLENYDSDARIRSLVNQSEIWIVPIVNPDGLEYSIHVYRYWRKNRRANADGSYGVDLNRNYSWQWGYDEVGSNSDPSEFDYRGTEPFSEPESAAVRDLFLSQDFQALVSYHSYTQLILYPWGYIDEPTSKDEEMHTLARTMSQLMQAVRGKFYAYGRASSGLYVTNGDTTDWAFGVAEIPAFTIELPPVSSQGGGFFNAESEIEPIFEENLPAMLYLTEYAVQNYALSPVRLRKEIRQAPPLIRFKRPSGSRRDR